MSLIVDLIYIYRLFVVSSCRFFFFQAEDGIRDLVRSRGFGDVYKRQAQDGGAEVGVADALGQAGAAVERAQGEGEVALVLSLIHI